MKRIAVTALFLALLLLLGGCSLPWSKEDGPSETEPEVEEDPEYPVKLAGADLSSRPGKLVSLSPAITEKLEDLGQADRLYGISKFCPVPAKAPSPLRCGTAQLPELEVIAEIAPHLLLTETALSEADLVALQQMNVEVALLPPSKNISTLGQLEETYRTLSVLLDGQTTGGMLGDRFARGLEERLDALSRRLGTQEEPKTALYLRLLGPTVFTVATGDTLENELMSRIGLRNIAGEQTGWEYPAALAGGEGLEDFRSLDLIVCDDSAVTIKDLEGDDFYKHLPAVLQDRYVYIDSTAFERKSMRMVDELEKIGKAAAGEAEDEEPAAAQ